MLFVLFVSQLLFASVPICYTASKPTTKLSVDVRLERHRWALQGQSLKTSTRLHHYTTFLFLMLSWTVNFQESKLQNYYFSTRLHQH